MQKTSRNRQRKFEKKHTFTIAINCKTILQRSPINYNRGLRMTNHSAFFSQECFIILLQDARQTLVTLGDFYTLHPNIWIAIHTSKPRFECLSKPTNVTHGTWDKSKVLVLTPFDSSSSPSERPRDAAFATLQGAWCMVTTSISKCFGLPRCHDKTRQA